MSRTPNLYLGFPPAKRASPIRLVMNPRGPINLTERLVLHVKHLHHRAANQRLHRLYGANTGAESIAFVVSYRLNDLIRVVTLHAAVMASGSLSYLMGCRVNGTKTTT